MEARRQLDDTDFLSSLMWVRVLHLLQQITFGFGQRYNDASTLFLIRCDICLRRQAHILFLYIILMFLHNYCSSSVKIGCTIRICSSTVEHRNGIIRRQERPTRPRYTKNENCEYNFSLKCILVNSPGEESDRIIICLDLFFSFVRSVREYRAP